MNLICYNKYCIEYNNKRCEKCYANSAGIKITANLSNSRNIVRYAQCIAAFGIAVDENFDGKYALSGRSDKAHAIGFTLHRAVNVPVQRCFNARVT